MKSVGEIRQIYLLERDNGSWSDNGAKLKRDSNDVCVSDKVRSPNRKVSMGRGDEIPISD